MMPENLRTFGRYVREIASIDSGLSAAIVSAHFVRTALEAYGLILLVPMLRLLGLGGQDGAAPESGASLARFLNPLDAGLGMADIGAAFLAVVVLRSLAGLVCSTLTARFQSKILHELRIRYHAAIGRARWSYLASQDPSHFSNGVISQPDVIAYSAASVCSAIGAAFALAAGALAALLISWQLTLIAILCAALLAVPLLVFDYLGFREAGRAAQSAERIYEHLGRRVGHLKLVRAQAIDSAMQASFEEISKSYTAALERQAVLTARAHAFHEAGAAALLLGLGYWALSSGAHQQLEPAALTVVFARLVPRVNQLQSSMRSVLSSLPYYHSYRAVLDDLQCAGEDGHIEALTDGQPEKLELRRELCFDAVSFRYPSNPAADALHGVTLSIPAGSALGVIGLNGAGKTTFLDLAAGLLIPSHGRILVDGKDIVSGRLHAWRRSISYLLQDDGLVNGSILENMRLGYAGASEEDIWCALERAHAAALVRSLPSGLETPVGERGAMLSRGQRQRLCLARALLTRPSVLLMDEGTSALNPVDEHDLAATFRSLRPDTTIIAVSHRPSALTFTDRLLVLDEGRISYFGPHAEAGRDPANLLNRMTEAERLKARA